MDFLECHEKLKEPGIECQVHEWKFIVYIPAASIKGSAEEAIRDNVKCSESLRDQTMASIREDGEGVLIVQDAVDELHSEDARRSLEEYTKMCKEITTNPKILVSTRSALCHIPSAYFDRCISIEGFTREQGIQFVEKYFKERYSIDDHCILEYIRNQSGELDVILCNPLKALIFSELTAKGSLTLQEVGTLNPIKLLKSLEGHILRREGERRSVQAKTESEAFYKLCLDSLLTDHREFSEEQMVDLPAYKAILIKQTNIDDEGEDCTSYVFPHEMIFEYFSVRGLIQYLENNHQNQHAILLYLCSNPNMCNILQFVSAYICQYKPGLFDTLISILRACLVLQHETTEQSFNEYAQDLLSLSEEIMQIIPKIDLQKVLSEDESKMINDIWRKINMAFTDDAEKLRDACWFRTLYHDERK